MPQAVKRQSRCPEVPYHGTGEEGGSTEYTSCRDRVSNRERRTLATRQQIKAYFPSRKLTSTTTVPSQMFSAFQELFGDQVLDLTPFGAAILLRATQKKRIPFASIAFTGP